MGRATEVARGRRRAHVVSTHALLLWGGRHDADRDRREGREVSTHALLLWGGRHDRHVVHEAQRHVSTHALLLWGGRPCRIASDIGDRGAFQPTPSSYGEGDSGRRQRR